MTPSRHADGGLTSIGINDEQLQRFWTIACRR
jgi:hypothetical protein